MKPDKFPEMPRSQILYGEIVYWITVVSCLLCMIGPVISVANPENNALDPYKLFNAVFAGKTADEVWAEAGDTSVKGGHFYLSMPFTGDGFTQVGLALGCSCALWGLLVAGVAYVRQKSFVYVLLALWVAALVALSMIGIVGMH